MEHMRITILLLFFGFVFSLQGQTIGVFSGVNNGRFYDLHEPGGHTYMKYDSQFGFKAGFEIKDVKLDTLLNLKFAIGYERYGGHFYTRTGGLGGSTTDDGTIVKDVLTVQFYPLNFKIANHITIRAGVEWNAMLRYQLSGQRYGWQAQSSPTPTNPYFSSDLNEISGLVKTNNFGFNFSFGYEFKIKKLIFEPSYNFFLGTSREFDRLQAETKSMRHSISISVGLGLK